MIITRIDQQKRDKSRYSVYIDGEFAFGLIMEDIMYFKLRVGEEIPEEKYRYIMDTTVYIKAQDTAIKYIGYKMRTAKEVRDKLSEYSEEVIDKVMDFLEKYEYIDDELYCEKYIEETVRLKPKGKLLIKQELKARGIDDDIISKALDEADIDEQAQAEVLLMKRYEDFANMDQKELARVYGYLGRKGYSYGVIKAAVSSLAEKGI
ncbi:MAG: RecX family transcriptional regulator [Clostridiales bacterium]|nr:RecX family transcriptional regulator [Clostridiales bacterium]